jgi:hypothetical protein
MCLVSDLVRSDNRYRRDDVGETKASNSAWNFFRHKGDRMVFASTFRFFRALQCETLVRLLGYLEFTEASTRIAAGLFRVHGRFARDLSAEAEGFLSLRLTTLLFVRTLLQRSTRPHHELKTRCSQGSGLRALAIVQGALEQCKSLCMKGKMA